VDFAWSRLRAAELVTEADCICSHQVAAHLIHLLYTGEELIPARPDAISRIQLETALRGGVS
jgi:hypothetical protein